MMLAYQNLRLLLFVALPIAFCSCNKPPVASAPPAAISQNGMGREENPEWLNEQIQEFKHEKPTNPPVKIYRYSFQGQEVYYVTGYCCDVPGKVFSKEGKQLCEPDGGITGRGDGKCPDFFNSRTNEKLIWEDLRK
jgi:hypothetical protein